MADIVLNLILHVVLHSYRSRVSSIYLYVQPASRTPPPPPFPTPGQPPDLTWPTEPASDCGTLPQSLPSAWHRQEGTPRNLPSTRQYQGLLYSSLFGLNIEIVININLHGFRIKKENFMLYKNITLSVVNLDTIYMYILSNEKVALVWTANRYDCCLVS